jgi:hypothetical protein
VYELSYGAADASGNSALSVATVTVRHDPGAGGEPLLLWLGPGPTPHSARIEWSSVPDALGYDLISGHLEAARLEADHLSLGTVRVLARDTKKTSFIEGPDAAVPSPGKAIFYLIQQRTARGGAGYGTESAPWPRLAAACEGGCP